MTINNRNAHWIAAENLEAVVLYVSKDRLAPIDKGIDQFCHLLRTHPPHP